MNLAARVPRQRLSVQQLSVSSATSTYHEQRLWVKAEPPGVLVIVCLECVVKLHFPLSLGRRRRREEGGRRKEEGGGRMVRAVDVGDRITLWHSGRVWDTAECHLTTHTHTRAHTHPLIHSRTHPLTSKKSPLPLHLSASPHVPSLPAETTREAAPRSPALPRPPHERPPVQSRTRTSPSHCPRPFPPWRRWPGGERERRIIEKEGRENSRLFLCSNIHISLT